MFLLKKTKRLKIKIALSSNDEKIMQSIDLSGTCIGIERYRKRKRKDEMKHITKP